MLDTRIAPRTMLAAAIAVKTAASLKLQRTSDAVKTARELLDQCAVELAAFGGLEAEIEAYNAEAFKAWGIAGGPGRPPSELTPELERATKDRADAFQRFNAAMSAHKSLAVENDQALREYSEAVATVDEATDAVLVEDAETVAADLERLQALTNALRFRLRAVCGQSRPVRTGGFQFLRISQRARGLCDFPREPFTSPFLNPERQEAERWQDYRHRLQIDPESVLDPS